MKKFLALFLVVLMLAFAGSAFAADSDGGHVTPTPPIDPGTGGTGSEGATETEATVTTEKPAVVVVVVSVAQANIVTAAQVTQPVATTIFNAIQNTVSSILSALGISGGSTTVQPASNLQVNEAEQYSSNNEAIEQGSARLANAGLTNRTAVGTLPRGMGVKETGPQPVKMPKFPSAMYGKTPQIDMFPRSAASRAGFAAAATGDGDAVFLDSTGAVVDVIPSENNANGAEPGELTAVVYMVAGEIYDPVISVPATEIANDPNIETSQVSVAEEVISSVKVMSTSTFSTYVDSALLTGSYANYEMIPVDAVSTAGWTDSAEDTALKTPDGENYEYFTTLTLPAISAPSSAKNYIAAVSFDRGAKTASDLSSGAALNFYPNNISGAQDTTAKFLKDSGGQLVELTASEVFGASSRYTRGYIAFQLSSAASKPAVLTQVKVAGEPSGGGLGSSGGGCSAGWSVLAFALLGGLIARKK